jgi:uncharacterized Zn finger protein
MDKDFNINLKEQPTVKCEQCQSVFFNEVTMIKKVYKLITGSPQDTIVPFPTYRCAECGHINDDFKIFE